MHPRKPRPTRRNPNPLPPNHKRNKHQIIRQQHRPESPRDNHRIPMLQNPVQQIQPHSKADRLLPQIHRNQHLGRIRIVRVHRVGEREREVEVRGPRRHGDAGEVAEPVEIVLCREGVDDQHGRGDEHGDQEHAEAHLGFADHVVLLGVVGCEAVRGGGEGDGGEEADDVGDGDEARVRLGPVVWWRYDLDREGVVEGESAEADVYAYLG